MKINSEKALADYKDSLRIGARTIYADEAGRFLDFADGELSKDVALGYLKWLEQEGYAPGTIVKISIPIMRKIFKQQNLPWPLRIGEAPSLKEGDTYAPALDPEVVKKMIAWARSPKGDRYERALLALATTYGMRRIELASMGPKVIDLRNQILLVRTAKGGRERWHLIPDEIVDVLHIRWPKNDGPKVSDAYLAIERKTGIARMPEVGWHSIRRILVRLLVEANLPAYTVDNFMRWKRGGNDMQRVYYGSTVVGEGQTRMEVGKMDKTVDNQVFAVHPFLPFWA